MPAKPIQSIAISEFKATCLAVLERVRRTGTPILITRRGKPIAEVIPPSLASAGTDWLGAMRDTATITGDLIVPASDAADWETLGK
ncbi:MAG: type II toxin-antitoxin system Phd/YefM family antitoxin [Gemmatimonadales bacterium]